MNKKFKVFAIALLGLLIVSFIILFRSCVKDETWQDVRVSQMQDGRSRVDTLSKEKREQEYKSWMIEKWDAAFGTPIDFWGKVVDQNGEPISGAHIEITLQDDPSWNPERSNNTKHTRTSDFNGYFKLLGKKGASLYVKASKEGYSNVKGKKGQGNLSAKRVYYASKKARARYQPPTKTNPTVLILRKKNPIANLEHYKRSLNLTKDGRAHVVNLGGQDEGIEVEVRCWSSVPVPFTYDKYDWHAEIRITGGQLKPITEIAPIEAPIDGYQASYMIDMNKNLGPNEWSAANYKPKDFWVKLDDGSYAKATIRIITGRKHQVTVEAWYNLEGTNNFEQ
jgi:hypothetical protein